MKKTLLIVLIFIFTLLGGCGLKPEPSIIIDDNRSGQASESASFIPDRTKNAGFTDEELLEMETVDETLGNLRISHEYAVMNTKQRADAVFDLLMELAEKGLVIEESISYDGDTMITYRYSCGILSGEVLKEFDPNLN